MNERTSLLVALAELAGIHELYSVLPREELGARLEQIASEARETLVELASPEAASPPSEQDADEAQRESAAAVALRAAFELYRAARAANPDRADDLFADVAAALAFLAPPAALREVTAEPDPRPALRVLPPFVPEGAE